MRRALAFAFVLVIGCRNEKKIVPDDATTKDAGPPAPELPVAVCEVTSTEWRPADAVEIRAADAHPPYAVIRPKGGGLGLAPIFGQRTAPPRTSVSMLVPEGEKKSAGIRIQSNGLRLSGLVATPWMTLAKPTLVTPFAAVSTHTQVRVTRATKDAVDLEIEPDESILVDPPLTLHVPCGALSLEHRQFDPYEVVPGGKPAPERGGLLPVDRDVPLSVTPGAPPVAKLHLSKDDDPGIAVFEKKGSHTRIAWTGSVIAFGWIPTRDVLPIQRTWDEGRMGREAPKPPEAVASVVCGFETAIVADGYAVGVVLPDQRIDIIAEEGDTSSIYVDDGVVHTPKGVKWSASKKDLSTCQRRK